MYVCMYVCHSSVDKLTFLLKKKILLWKALKFKFSSNHGLFLHKHKHNFLLPYKAFEH